MNMEFHTTAKSASSQQTQKVTRRMVNMSMNTKNDSCPPPIDSIVKDEITRSVLEELNLMPSDWGLPEDEQLRILHRGLTIRAEPDLNDPNWPAFENSGVVTFSSNAFVTGAFSREQLLAILLHEVGHRVNPSPKVDDDPYSADLYVDALLKLDLDQKTKPANRDELYADHYARHCGYSDHLEDGLRLMYEIRENFRIQSTRERIARLEADERPLLLNLTPLPK